MPRSVHLERHRTEPIGWLRAAVLGANDGIVSTASLIVGVAAASAGRSEMLVAGVAGLVAGAMSMAAGEYVSVSSQSDTERADVAREQDELVTQPDFERRELAAIYVARGLTPELATQVAQQLMAHDALLLRRVDPQHRSQGQCFQDEIASPLGLDLYLRLPETIPNSRLATIAPPGRMEMLFGSTRAVKHTRSAP